MKRMSDDGRSSGGCCCGCGFFVTISMVLAILKLTGVIDWSWFVVFSPVLAGIAINLAVWAIGALIVTLIALFDN